MRAKSHEGRSRQRWSLLLAAGWMAVTSFACVTNRCVASEKGTPGRIMSCCGSSPSYYWTGTRCEPDPSCQCDGTPAKPSWSTLQGCEERHRTCVEFDKQ